MCSNRMTEMATEKINTSLKYEQIAQILRKEITQGEKFQQGQKFYSESELKDRFNVSHMTVRQSVGILVAEELLCREQGRGTFLASSSKRSKTKLIGVLVPRLSSNSALSKIIGAMDDVAKEKGYHLLLSITEENFKKSLVYSQKLVDKDVAGIVFFPHNASNKYEYFKWNSRIVRNFVKRDIPVVLIDRHLEKADSDIDVDYVITDNVQGGYELTSHLIGLGHRRIAFVDVQFSSTVEERLSGYKQSLKENNIGFDTELVKVVRMKKLRVVYEHCHSIINEFLGMKDGPTAIFAVHDGVARNVILALREEEKKVPEDIAIVGYDDLEVGELFSSPLTTIQQPLEEEGQLTASILIDNIEGKRNRVQHIILPSKLIIRESCGAKLIKRER